jgi:hypothetical protein
MIYNHNLMDCTIFQECMEDNLTFAKHMSCVRKI